MLLWMSSKANEPEVKGRRRFKEHTKLTHIDRNVFTYIVSMVHGCLLFVFVEVKWDSLQWLKK